MSKLVPSKKTILLLLLLFFVFMLINSKCVWQLMYPIKYEEEVKKISKEFNTDPYLILAIIQVETKFKEDKVSKKGAVGLMQVMPETANWIVQNSNFHPDILEKLFDPEINIALGSWYLAYISKIYEGNRIATVAAYNAGPGNVSKWINTGTWNGTLENIDLIPFGETRHYVQRVFYFYSRYKWIYENNF